MLEGIRAVIFDLDGTLMDSMWMWREIDVEYLGRYGLTPPDGMEKEIEGMGFTETAAYFRERFCIPDSVEAIKRDWVAMSQEKYANEVSLKPGAGRFLRRLRQMGLRTGIASSNCLDLIESCLAANGVREFIDCITTSCDVAKGKPAPDVYLSVATSLGVNPEECLVFEDVPMGILAGKSAGMRVCAVKDAFSEAQTDTIRSLADYYITSYDEILDGTYETMTGEGAAYE